MMLADADGLIIFIFFVLIFVGIIALGIYLVAAENRKGHGNPKRFWCLNCSRMVAPVHGAGHLRVSVPLILLVALFQLYMGWILPAIGSVVVIVVGVIVAAAKGASFSDSKLNCPICRDTRLQRSKPQETGSN